MNAQPETKSAMPGSVQRLVRLSDLNVICLRCDSEQFRHSQDEVIVQIYKGKTLKVHCPAVVCRKCGWVTVGIRQADELIRRTKKLYNIEPGRIFRRKHTGTKAVIIEVNERGVKMRHASGRLRQQNWHTVFNVWEPTSPPEMAIKAGFMGVEGGSSPVQAGGTPKESPNAPHELPPTREREPRSGTEGAIGG